MKQYQTQRMSQDFCLVSILSYRAASAAFGQQLGIRRHCRYFSKMTEMYKRLGVLASWRLGVELNRVCGELTCSSLPDRLPYTIPPAELLYYFFLPSHLSSLPPRHPEPSPSLFSSVIDQLLSTTRVPHKLAFNAVRRGNRHPQLDLLRNYQPSLAPLLWWD